MNATAENHIQKVSPIDPDFVKKFKDKFYVDDLNTGVYSVDEGINLCKKQKVRFQEAKFNLKKWRNNNEILHEFIKLLNVNPAVSTEFVMSDLNSEITVNKLACA